MKSTLSISVRAKPLLLWLVLSLSILSPFTSAFVSPLFRSSNNKSSSKDSTALYLAKIKRGRLSPNFLEQEDFDSTNKKTTGPRIKERSKRLSKKKKNATSAAKQQTKKNTPAAAVVSPDLAQWAASSSEDDSSNNKEVTTDSTTEQLDSVDETDAATFQSFDQDSSSTNKKASSRRVRQSERQAAEQARGAEIEAQVALVKECLGIVDKDDEKDEKENKSTPQTNIADLLNILQHLTNNQKSSSDVLAALKQLSSSKTSTDYRLAWVGSDAAICHIGTGLHKVPLARLQEVFLTLPGRNQVVLQEVIRILGPFPNIRNTLQGTCRPSSNSSGETVDWNWTWESMVDGTGKEILAGKEENTQSVPLTVHFAHSSMVVASVPGDDKDGDTNDRPWKEDGENVLLFLREDDILTSLEKLRVA